MSGTVAAKAKKRNLATGIADDGNDRPRRTNAGFNKALAQYDTSSGADQPSKSTAVIEDSTLLESNGDHRAKRQKTDAGRKVGGTCVRPFLRCVCSKWSLTVSKILRRVAIC